MAFGIEQPYLPNEVWDRIFCFLRPTYNDEDETDPNELWGSKWNNTHYDCWENKVPPPTSLLNLCLVSKRFYNLVKPSLFKTVVLYDDAACLRFIVALVRQPFLGQHVENLVCEDGWSPLPTEEVRSLCVTASDAFDAALSSLVLPSKLRRYFRHGIKWRNGLALIALIIAYCPRLKQLDLKMMHSGDFPWKVLTEVTKVREVKEQSHLRLLSAGHLSRLRKLRLITTEPCSRKGQTQLAVPFKLPNLGTLICDFSWGGFYDRKLAMIPDYVGLRRLNLIEPDLSQGELVNLFRHTPELRVFQVKLASFNTSWRGFLTTLGTVGGALRYYSNHCKDNGRSHLETLVIHSDKHASRAVETIESLQPLINLRRLSIKLRDLVGPLHLRHRYDDWQFSWEGPDLVEVAISASDSPPLTIDQELPNTLEVLEIQHDWDRIHWIVEYFHHQVTLMISNENRANLHRVVLQLETNGFVHLSYTRNTDKRWTITSYNSELNTGLSKALEACPMMADGLFTVLYNERPDIVE